MQKMQALADNIAVITIINTDPIPGFVYDFVDEKYVSESDAAFNYSVELDLSKSELPIEIGYTVTSVTAESGSDYNALSSGTITIPASGLKCIFKHTYNQ